MHRLGLAVVFFAACGAPVHEVLDAGVREDANSHRVQVVQTATLGPVTGTPATFDLPWTIRGQLVIVYTSVGDFGYPVLHVGGQTGNPYFLTEPIECAASRRFLFELLRPDQGFESGQITLPVIAEDAVSLVVLDVLGLEEYIPSTSNDYSPNDTLIPMPAASGDLVVTVGTSCTGAAKVHASSPFESIEVDGTTVSYFAPSEVGAYAATWSTPPTIARTVVFR